MSGLRWTEQAPPEYQGNETRHYAKGVHGRWDGDESGQWECGYNIHGSCEELPALFLLFEDDGQGNGNGLGSFKSLGEAQEAAEQHDANPWTYERKP